MAKPEYVPSNIRESTRFYPYFNDCIGAIDGTHISAMVVGHEECCSDEFPLDPKEDPIPDQENNFEWNDFQTQEQHRDSANEWRMSIANHMWEDVKPNVQQNVNNENDDNKESDDEGEK
ncbi:uncharacterized protein LOC126797139 [Argentina anserina]|uniref:uncharacterized protein LOC126797139 n=1 Tax=Argentina anserina TaxID=57926 RepID=UPI0021766A8F|nr:uncharacterized protein LOC126797139 [Potentilla anserina]